MREKEGIKRIPSYHQIRDYFIRIILVQKYFLVKNLNSFEPASRKPYFYKGGFSIAKIYYTITISSKQSPCSIKKVRYVLTHNFFLGILFI